MPALDALDSPCIPSPGQLVTVRQRRFVVAEVIASSQASALASPQSPQHLIHLRSVDDEGLGEELSVIWELEAGTQLFERTTLPDPARGFDPPDRLEAFLNAIRWGAVASADVSAVHAPFRSGAIIEDYQLEPLVRAIEMPRVSLLIADDVGLGKTIEAGLVMQELLLRYRARTVLVVCPAGLQLQWRDQMRDKFGLDFRIVDSEALRDLRRRRGLNVNPWTHFPRLITSIDFLKRERPMRLMADAHQNQVYPRKFGLLIVDEAHNVAPSGRGEYAMPSMRTECIQSIAPHFEHKLFLTATPHNGYTESFAALLELLDNQRFHRGMTPDRAQLERVMVRRLKKELPPDDLGRARFPKRSLEAIEVDFPDDELRAHMLLKQYAELRASNEDEPIVGQFVMKLLKKRLFSSPEAFHLTLETHSANQARGGSDKHKPVAKIPEGILRRELARLEEDFDQDDLYEEETQALVRTSSKGFRPLSPAESKIVDELLAWSEKSAARLDAKAKGLLAWLDTQLRTDGKWNDTRVIIFTEYRATQKWLEGILAARGYTQNGRLLSLYGGMSPDERESIKQAFQCSPDKSAVRILLATDAASEGIDLQNYCSRLLHYEVPWNPNRMEQRNGRVDRHGQKAEEVQIFHFVGKGWHDQRISKDAEPGTLVGDLEFLFRAARKVDQIREDLGNAGDVLSLQIEEAMIGKRKQLDVEKTAPRSSAARKMITFEQKIEARLRSLMEKLRVSRDELHVDPASLQSVVEVGLKLAGHPGLIPSGSTKERTFLVPALRGTWASCLDGLLHPHTQEVRPISFDHNVARDRDDIVLAHMGHRLVQMCVGLLRAEVWAPEEHRKLSRVSARSVSKLEEPMVVAHARLVVLGGDNVRLHEEMIQAGGALRGGKYAALGSTKLSALLQSCAGEVARPVDKATEKSLVDLWKEHGPKLHQALENRVEERKQQLDKQLAKRCDKEVLDFESVLQELERSIKQELFGEEPTDKQLVLKLDFREKEQLERDRISLRQRLETIPEEIVRETGALRERYASPTVRIFPVAVTYLVPSSMVSR